MELNFVILKLLIFLIINTKPCKNYLKYFTCLISINMRFYSVYIFLFYKAMNAKLFQFTIVTISLFILTSCSYSANNSIHTNEISKNVYSVTEDQLRKIHQYDFIYAMSTFSTTKEIFDDISSLEYLYNFLTERDYQNPLYGGTLL